MDLGIKVLKLPDYKIQSTLFDLKDSIQAAAYDMIRFWSQQQPNRQEAYNALHKGLKKAQMFQLTSELQLWVAGTEEGRTETLQEGKVVLRYLSKQTYLFYYYCLQQPAKIHVTAALFNFVMASIL